MWLVKVMSEEGGFLPYLPIEHKDISEFLDIGTEGNPIQELTHGVTVTDKWMEEMIEGDQEKRNLWAKVIQRRGEIGYPYIFFKDKANQGAPEVFKDTLITQLMQVTYVLKLCYQLMIIGLLSVFYRL